VIKTSFHTHTTFCDGKNTPEEMVLAAIEKGFAALGFSTHSPASPGGVPQTYTCTDIKGYIAEINRLKEKYKDKIKIYCGIEMDYYSKVDPTLFEYTIASVHTIEKDGKFFEVDHCEQAFLDSVKNVWNGDYYAYAEDYFDFVSRLKGDIIGHIDLMTKFNEGDKLFSTKDKRYLDAAEKCVKKLCENNKIFEINTGAIGRGYRKTPYPSEEILKMIKKYGGEVIITSDCHNKDYIDCGYDKAFELAKKCGFTKINNLFV